jgi:uncharacterized phage protein (TIGR02220 family)
MKRFTETTKWADVWFRKLSPSAKLFWQWLCDNCDAAGVIEPDFDLATFQIGLPMGIDTLSELGDRVSKLPCGKFHVVKFVNFQWGDRLSHDCKAHNAVFQSLERHSISLESIGYPKGNVTPQAQHSTAKAKAQTGGCKGDPKPEPEPEEEVYSTESRVVLHFLNERTGKRFRESETSLAPINARMKEPGVTLDGVKKMISRQCELWLETRMQEYLRPETLFGKEKFNSYYASKDVPVNHADRKQPELQQNGF